MNTSVTATGMMVKAKADDGILIKTDSTNFTYTIPDPAKVFKSTTDVGMSAGTEVLPVSTINASDWYRNSSDEFDNAKAAQAAATYTAVTEATGYYAKFGFKIRSAAQAVAMTNVKLRIDSVTVTPPTTQLSAALNKALRVAVVYGTQAFIFAPLEVDTTEFFNGGNTYTFAPTYSDPTSVTVYKAAGTQEFTLTSNTIPASDTGIDVFVYVYFEGEDANCKSSNITASLDDIGVSVQFSAQPTT